MASRCQEFICRKATAAPMKGAVIRPLRTASPADADPKLRVEVDGRTLDPAAIEAGRYRFVIGPGATLVRLVSRTAVPAQDQPGGSDERRLGIALNRIILRGHHLELFLPHDDPTLVDGFHPAEAGHRWTNGRALLPAHWLRGLQQGFILEIAVNPSALRYRGRG